MFEVEYLWNGWPKKDEVNANSILAVAITLDIPIDFAFSPRLNHYIIIWYEIFLLYIIFKT